MLCNKNILLLVTWAARTYFTVIGTPVTYDAGGRLSIKVCAADACNTGVACRGASGYAVIRNHMFYRFVDQSD